MREAVTALLPDMWDYLRSVQPTECPMSLDNWAAMVQLDYKQMRVVLLQLDPTLYYDYVGARRNFWKSIERELLALEGSPDYTADYTRPIAEKYGITMKDVQRIRTRLGLMCVPKHSRLAEVVRQVLKVGLTLLDLAQASGLTVEQVQGMHSRGHLDRYAEFGYATHRDCKERRRRMIVVTRVKTQEKPRDRSKSRR